MPFQSAQGTEFYYFQNLSAAGIPHGIFTRRGGMSPAPWESLNVGLMVGDDAHRVAENTRRALFALGRRPESIRLVHQVHGATVVADGTSPDSDQIPQADGVVTNRRGLTLSMRYADCVPLLLADPENGAVAIGHAGWRGTVGKIAAELVRRMAGLYGSRPENLLVGIGPAICADHYEIGLEVADQVTSAFGRESRQVLHSKNGRVFFDLWLANQLTLQEAGVAHIETSEICTVDRPDDWFSHRGEKGRTGRFLALIGMDGG